MDLKAVKAASVPALLACVAAAAENADGLLEDAERLAGAGRYARAYSLSALAVEEFGKAASLLTLANMPRDVRAQAPVGRMLEWHQLKLVGGTLMAVAGFGPPGMAARFAAMPISRLEQILDATHAFADDADARKRRGLYVDMDGHGRIRRPSEITEAERGRPSITESSPTRAPAPRNARIRSLPERDIIATLRSPSSIR